MSITVTSERSVGICTVVELGSPLRIVRPDGQPTLAECLSGIPVLRVGDRVLVHLDSVPAVVIGRLGGIPDDLTIEAGKTLTIRCGGGTIRIRADGRIVIDGLDIISRARRAQRVSGAQVIIN